MSYKHLQRQFRRLPLPQPIIIDGGPVLKRHYLASGARQFAQLLNAILVDEKYQQLPKVLDFIYKDDKPRWLKEFKQIPYKQLKGKWPVVHMIDKLNVDKSVYNAYDRPPVVVADMIPGEPGTPLPLLRHYANQYNNVADIVKNVEQMYHFLLSNRGVFDVTRDPMEVVHFPSKFGTVHHPATLDRVLRNRITKMRHVFQEYQPIPKQALDKLVAIYRESTPINKHFARYSARLRANEECKSASVRNLLRKEFVPDDNDVHEMLQEYLRAQFFRQDGKYILNSEY
ncbi:hypothetical protein Cantr_01002 [Candida viswanathii]|uniref:Genetic interactor of prohibitin 5, mitochondrial n=1 Tax=Candida viswanathii TaxID=5486 RepID=A0A367YGU7_9ASCO|nr:hypothetical protein Cantr_01002 [Candida viswanathii]